MNERYLNVTVAKKPFSISHLPVFTHTQLVHARARKILRERTVLMQPCAYACIPSAAELLWPTWLIFATLTKRKRNAIASVATCFVSFKIQLTREGNLLTVRNWFKSTHWHRHQHHFHCVTFEGGTSETWESDVKLCFRCVNSDNLRKKRKRVVLFQKCAWFKVWLFEGKNKKCVSG